MAEGLLAQIEQSQNTIGTDASTFTTVNFNAPWDSTTIDPNPWIHNHNEDKKGFMLLTLGYFSPFVKPFTTGTGGTTGTTVHWNTGNFTWTESSTTSTARWLDMGTAGKIMSK